MSLALVGACIWFVLANVLAMLPSKDGHVGRAAFLVVIGVPILGWVTLSNGPFVGLLVLAGGASVLRWPLMSLGRWFRRRIE